MQTTLVRDLVEGEIRDVAFTHRALDDIDEPELLDMYRQKSASLLGYCACVGAMLALDEPDPAAPVPAALARFATTAGIAFQIRDDVLGLVGSEARLGKPVGSDVREGKRTPILLAAYARADAAHRRRLDAVIGKEDATGDELREAAALLEELGGVAHARTRAESLVDEAVSTLRAIPDSDHRARLADWARMLVKRDD
jgi:geranylgeranyl diphosphate synthase type I